MVQLFVTVAGGPAESTALTAKLVLPTVGVPVIAPVTVFKNKPVGSDPMIENVKGDVPPVAMIADEYGMPDWAELFGQVTLLRTGGAPDTTAPGLTPVLSSNVTAPVRAKALPFNTAPVVSVTDAWAMMVPTKIELVPRVAELPTCQNTLAACAPPMRTTRLLDAVVSALPIWKMKKPGPLSVSVPVIPSDVADV
jgi:hypothetical protein